MHAPYFFNRKVLFLSFLFPLIFVQCRKDSHQAIPGTFAPYVQSFLQEAKKRGLNLSAEMKGLRIVKKPIDPSYDGLCYEDINRIEIDAATWDHLDEANREFLLFHELGHCLLGRAHFDEPAQNGECRSFMRGKTACRLLLGSSLWRTYYLDELFDPFTPLPDWYTGFQDPDRFGQVDATLLHINDSLTTELAWTQPGLEQAEKLVIRAEVKDWEEGYIPGTPTLAVLQVGSVLYYFSPGGVDKVNIQGKGMAFSTSNGIDQADLQLQMVLNGPYVHFYANGAFVQTLEREVLTGNALSLSYDQEKALSLQVYTWK